MNTRSLYVLDSVLASWTGAGVYTWDGQGTPQPVSGFQPVGALFNFYEVSVVPGRGSWWLPTTLSTLAPQQWLSGFGGIMDLAVTGTDIPTQSGGISIVRPGKLLWWIPEWLLGRSLFVPASTVGTVSGPFPSLEPPGQPEPPVPPQPPVPPGPPGPPPPPPPPPPTRPSMRVELTATGARLIFKHSGLPSVLELDVEPEPPSTPGGSRGG